MQITLFEPEIPPNTGNIARLCAAFGIVLNLVQPLGFSLEDKYLKRAGLDYWPHVAIRLWPDWSAFVSSLAPSARLVLATTKGSRRLPDFPFARDDVLVFGPETRGLPDRILQTCPLHVRIPMIDMDAGGVRSLNLATAAGIVLYAALVSSGLVSDYS